MPLDIGPSIVTLTEASRLLGINPSALYNAYQRGWFPIRRIGGTVLCDLDQVQEAFVSRRKAKTSA